MFFSLTRVFFTKVSAPIPHRMHINVIRYSPVRISGIVMPRILMLSHSYALFCPPVCHPVNGIVASLPAHGFANRKFSPEINFAVLGLECKYRVCKQTRHLRYAEVILARDSLRFPWTFTAGDRNPFGSFPWTPYLSLWHHIDAHSDHRSLELFLIEMISIASSTCSRIWVAIT